MARGTRKSIDEKIALKEDIISKLGIRLEKENEELNALYREKRDEEVRSLYEFILESNLSVEEATDILKQNLVETVES